jgi:predicted HTH domain antitoxin
MRVAVDLPNDFVEMLTEQAIAKEMRLAYALALFKDARITIAKAAELAGITIYEFMAACKANRIPVIEVSREELVQELQSIGRNPRSWSRTALP